METDHGKLGSVVTGEGDPVAGLVAQQGHRFTQQRSDQQLTSSVAMDLTVVAEYLCKRDIGPPAGCPLATCLRVSPPPRNRTLALRRPRPKFGR